MSKKSDIPKPGESGTTKLVVKTIEQQLKSKFDDEIKNFFNTYVDVTVLGYSVDHAKKSYNRTYVITLQGILFTKESF